MRELCAQSLTGFYDYMKIHKEIAVDGFRKAGLIPGIESCHEDKATDYCDFDDV